MGALLSNDEVKARMFAYTATNRDAGTEKFLGGMAKAVNEAALGQLGTGPFILYEANHELPRARLLVVDAGLELDLTVDGVARLALRGGEKLVAEGTAAGVARSADVVLCSYNLSALPAGSACIMRVTAKAAGNDGMMLVQNLYPVTNQGGGAAPPGTWALSDNVDTHDDFHAGTGLVGGCSVAVQFTGSVFEVKTVTSVAYHATADYHGSIYLQVL
jgi:hypothetical protein